MSSLPVDLQEPSARSVFEPLVLTSYDSTFADLGPIWIIEETTGHLRTQRRGAGASHMRLYCIRGNELSMASELAQDGKSSRVDTAIALLDLANAQSGVVVCSFRTASSAQLLERLVESRYANLHYVLEVDWTRRLEFARARNGIRSCPPKDRVETASWQQVNLSGPAGDSECYAANLGRAGFGGSVGLTCFALSVGGITGYQRGILIGVTSLELKEGFKRLAQLLAWTRWIRLAVRRAKRMRSEGGATDSTGKLTSLDIVVRANRKIALGQDVKAAHHYLESSRHPAELKHRLTADKKTLNVIELFAGAGGMGLGFLNARSPDGRGYRIVGSAEIHPIYTQTLRRNHAFMEKEGLTPVGATPAEYAPMDLCSDKTRARLGAMAKARGSIDVMIGGPPCQGFSSANRNSWSSSNPNNRLVDAFLQCVSEMAPKVLLMENVQGILWTPRDEVKSDLSVAAHVLERLTSMGYLVFPKLLDAVWFGAPQNRNRFFLLGIHKDLGYTADDFGKWGPFPQPSHGPGTDKAFVTVRDAIADLPKLCNGSSLSERSYKEDPARLLQNEFLCNIRVGAPKHVIWDHVTSRHADYVIERYKGIGQGQNWQAVRALMTNYAQLDRTHSNIYRRLAWDEPAITIGHYRKSMIIHPSQHRGLSLREAARLQGFPDWFRFAGSESGDDGGLMHKQQQLANAVCPSVTKAVAEYILNL